MRKKCFLFFVLFVFFFLLNYFSLALKIKDTIFSFFCPLSSFLREKARKITENFFLFFEEKKNIEQEKKKLEEEKNLLLSELKKLQDLKEENQQLRKALNLELQEEFNLLLANIIQLDILKGEIVIDKGRKDEVKEGDCLILGDKVVIGKVKKVLENFSIVSLIFSKNFIFSIKVGMEEEIYGIGEGKGGERILIRELPKKEIKEKDIVFTSSFGGVFPPNLLVGEIEKIEKRDIQPFQKAIVKVFFNPREIKKVFVIKR